MKLKKNIIFITIFPYIIDRYKIDIKIFALTILFNRNRNIIFRPYSQAWLRHCPFTARTLGSNPTRVIIMAVRHAYGINGLAHDCTIIYERVLGGCIHCSSDAAQKDIISFGVFFYFSSLRGNEVERPPK